MALLTPCRRRRRIGAFVACRVQWARIYCSGIFVHGVPALCRVKNNNNNNTNWNNITKTEGGINIMIGKHVRIRKRNNQAYHVVPTYAQVYYNIG